MTIAVAVRTGSAVVFAADSKVTTRAIAGRDEKDEPVWVEQTWDNATKLARARSGWLIGMVAGAANVGQVAATDLIERIDAPVPATQSEQDQQIATVVGNMAEERKRFWSQTTIPPEEWPGPTLVLAAPMPAESDVRVWHADLSGVDPVVVETLERPFVRFEGAYNEVFALFYGYEDKVLSTLAKELGATPEQLAAAAGKLRYLRPIDQINFYTMPLQDAIDFAVFAATVQIEMDRFTPGTPFCGGPIDVMVLRATPAPEILTYPGKVLHHPLARGSL
jgi:hypothetical protein